MHNYDSTNWPQYLERFDRRREPHVTSAEFIYTVILRPPPLRRFANWILRSSTPKMVNRHGANIVLNSSDPVVSGALTFRVYERAETEFFLNAFRPGMTLLDVETANIGYYTRRWPFRS